MWGATSFSELAKKAQEASELATKRAQEASTSMNTTLGDTSGISSLFNLDSMIAKSGSFGDTEDKDTTGNNKSAANEDNDGDDDSYDEKNQNADADATTTAASSTASLSRLSPMPEISESVVANDAVDDNNDNEDHYNGSTMPNDDEKLNGFIQGDEKNENTTDAQNGHGNTDMMPETVKMAESIQTDDGEGKEMSSPQDINNNITVETEINENDDNDNDDDQSPSSPLGKLTSLTSFVDMISPIAKTDGNNILVDDDKSKLDLKTNDAIENNNENENENGNELKEEEVANGDSHDVCKEGGKDDKVEVLEDEAEVALEVEESSKKDTILDHEEVEEQNENSIKEIEDGESNDTEHADDGKIMDSDVDRVADISSLEKENLASSPSFTNNETSDENNDKEENDDGQVVVSPEGQVGTEVKVVVETNVDVEKSIALEPTDSENKSNGVEASTTEINGEPVTKANEFTKAEHDEQFVKENVGLSINTSAQLNDSQLDDSLISPLSQKDERAMSFSMAVSTEKCDSEKDLDISQDVDSDGDINEMYEDNNDESKDENVCVKDDEDNEAGLNSQEVPQQTEEPNALPHVPQFAIEKFMAQLERLHQQHEGELQEMERKHQIQICEMKEEIDSATSKKNSRNEVGNNDKFLAQLRKLERDFDDRLEKKDGQIADLVEINKLMEDQIEDLKREADGLNKSLEARNEMIATVKEKDEEIESLKTSLKDTQSDLETSNESFATLKGRVKVVATELKERRIECRNLNVTVQDLTLSKSRLESENKDFATKVATLEHIKEERDQEIQNLRKSVSELRVGLKSKEKELVEKGSVGDKALNTYKKKAQTLLGNANARAAAANQAREDAEIDAANARAEAEDALKVAHDAEKEKNDIVSDALKEVQKLQKQVDDLKLEKDKIGVELEATQAECLKAFEDVKESQQGRDSLLDDLNTKEIELEKEIEKNSGLEQDAAMSRIKTKDLEDEVANLKFELEKATTAAFMARKREAEAQSYVSSSTFGSGGFNSEQKDKNDSTIIMLQQELEVANDVIKDLKETLGTIISEDPSKLEPDELIRKVNSFGEDDTTHNGVNGNHSTPLFFAFEKQAELNTARDEITRLAALLGDAESEKMEATEAKEEMRKKMEEAESRLRRFEKLGAASGGRQMNGSSFAPSHGSRFGASSSHFHTHSVGNGSSHSDSSVNLEYLKNIMLRYMNAMSLNEKKALIPVIAAVLELTADEQAKALESVENSAGIQGVGTSLIENVQNKGFVNGLFGDML